MLAYLYDQRHANVLPVSAELSRSIVHLFDFEFELHGAMCDQGARAMSRSADMKTARPRAAPAPAGQQGVQQPNHA